MRAFIRSLVALPLVGLLACTQAVADSNEGAEVETESTEAPVSVTNTPGKAVWTKVWRWSTSSERTRATDVATDDAGASFVTRVKHTDNVNGYPDSADVARYSATGALTYRVSLTGHDLIIPDSLHVAARGGRLVTVAERGASGIVTVLDAASGAVARTLTLAADAPSPTTTGYVFMRDVAVDDDGGFVVLASAVGDVDWGTGPMRDQSINSNTDAIVARFSRDGVLLAARRFEGASGKFVSIDGNGNIYVASRGSLTSPYTQTNSGVNKLSRSLLVTDYFFLDGEAAISAMDVSRGGRVVFGGDFAGSLRVGPNITLEESNVESKYGDAYAVKLDPGMMPSYAGSFASSSRTIVSGIGIDSYGQVVVAMNFLRDVTFDGRTYTASGSDEQLALVKLGATGFTPRWTRIYGATSATLNYVRASALSITDNDRIMMVGEFRTDVDFGAGTIDGSPGGNAFLARLYQ